MIALILYDLRWRMLALVGLAAVLYALEPGFHQHETVDFDAINLGPLGVSAAYAHFAGLAMIILLAGLVSRDRHEGYTRLYFANPTSPLAYYALRVGVAYGVVLTASLLFLVLSQLLAWRTMPGGWEGLLLPTLTGIVYGGLVAFLSVLLPRGDSWAAFLLFLPTFFPQLLVLAFGNSSLALRQAVLLIVPPQGAIADVWNGLLVGSLPWGAVAYAAAYGIVLLLAAGALLWAKEWP